MINRNVEEYKLIRQEMINLKDCITKYIGYVFAGSGAMIYGLAKVENNNEIIFISASFSMLISLVLFTLFYKFNSHNRFAGFCKLLNHERHDLIETVTKTNISLNKKQINSTQECLASDNEPPLFSWEITVGDLRWLESKPNYLGNILDKINIQVPAENTLREKIENIVELNSKEPLTDKWKHIKGILIILKTILLKNISTDSWGFPPLVVCIFLFLVSGFLGVSTFMTYQNGIFSNILLSAYVGIVLFLQLCLWWYVSGKLYSLMHGSCTVYSYYWKFIPLRTLFLNNQNPKIKPSFISIEEWMFVKKK